MKLKHTLVFQHGSLGLALVWMLKKRGKGPASLQGSTTETHLAVRCMHRASRTSCHATGGRLGARAWETIKALSPAPKGLPRSAL